MIRHVLRRLTRHLAPPRMIYDRMGESPYLSRYYLSHSPRMPEGGAPFDARGVPKPGVQWPKFPIGIYLHLFHRGDSELELHNHPWKWAVSFVLAGGYSEERRVGNKVVRRRCPPGSINVLRSRDFHRVDLLEEDAWTLFVTGPKFADWGFWRRETGEFWGWRTFIDELRRP